MSFTPTMLAQWLQEVWHELGGNPQLAPPAAWMEVAAHLQRKIVAGVLKRGDDMTAAGLLDAVHEDQRRIELDPDSPPVEMRLHEPKAMLANVPVIYELGPTLAAHCKRITFEAACRLLFGQGWGRAVVKDPTITELPALINGSRPLLALLPTMIQPNPGNDWLPLNCDFCSRLGLLGKEQYALKQDSKGLCICPPCVSRLVGVSAQSDLIALLWGKHEADNLPDNATEENADGGGQDQAGDNASDISGAAADHP